MLSVIFIYPTFAISFTPLTSSSLIGSVFSAASSVSAISTDIDVEIKSDLSVLRWALMVYKNIDMYFNDAIDTLNQAAFNTGSTILKNEIRKIIDHLNCMTPNIRAVKESTEEMLYEKSAFFAALKKNGLRQIEDDLYEYKVRYKNCDTTEEALYIIRQINSRIAW